MAKVSNTKKEVDKKTKFRPASTPEARESQLISLAVECAEEQLRNGTASSAVICHYLKMGSTRQQQETEKLQEEIKLLKAKTEALQSAKNVEELYINAINSMKLYGGHRDE